jgi:hypothetical protein
MPPEIFDPTDWAISGLYIRSGNWLLLPVTKPGN